MKARVELIEDVSFAATAGSGHKIVLDGPPEHGGLNRGARPMELILMGLGGCSAFDVLHILRKGHLDVQDCRVEIEAERAPKVPKVFTRIHMHFVVSGRGLPESKVTRAIELSTQKYCSASIMLSKAATITHDHEIIQT